MVEQKEASLTWPFLIIGVGIILSLSFVFFVLRNYQKPHPLLIKPSSVESFHDVSKAIYKSMFPMIRQGYTFHISPLINEDEIKLAKSLSKFVSPNSSDKVISITLQKVQLDKEIFNKNEKFNCKENILFNLLRKKEKKWKKRIYFSVCKEKEDLLIMGYSIKNQLDK